MLYNIYANTLFCELFSAIHFSVEDAVKWRLGFLFYKWIPRIGCVDFCILNVCCNRSFFLENLWLAETVCILFA